MSAFILKMIAIVSMFLDHFGYFLNHTSVTIYNYFGRLAFPIFAFQISEGYVHTSNVKKYLFRLFIFALISQIPFQLLMMNTFHFDFSLNVFFTLFLGLLSILVYDKCPNKILGLIAVAGICALGSLIKVDYEYWGILLIFLFYLFKNNKVLTAISFLFMCILKYGILIINNGFNIVYVYLAIATFSAIVPILLYNGKLGPKTKKLLYVFYPGHMLLLYIASLL